jgi:hypothetical protein
MTPKINMFRFISNYLLLTAEASLHECTEIRAAVFIARSRTDAAADGVVALEA